VGDGRTKSSEIETERISKTETKGFYRLMKEVVGDGDTKSVRDCDRMMLMTEKQQGVRYQDCKGVEIVGSNRLREEGIGDLHVDREDFRDSGRREGRQGRQDCRG
jgi:hypothetical protein